MLDAKDILDVVRTDQSYKFLQEEPLRSQTILLGLGGSYAYGTNVEGSDIDLRGIATHSPTEILTGKGFEQIEDSNTDTVIYSLRKMINLLCACNPNTIEILGLEPWQYLVVTDAGQKLIDNAHLFLSKRAVHSFRGYANAQLWRLRQKCIRGQEQDAREKHILNSIESARYSFSEKYAAMNGEIRLYTGTAINPELDTEVFMDVSLKHYPLRDYDGMWEEMRNIVKSYNHIGARNSKAVEHGKLSKHMLQLARLFFMAFDILEEGKIVTYRKKEHDFLMDIRNGRYLGEDELPTQEFYDIIETYEERLKRDAEKTELPDHPDYDKIDKLVAEINMQVIEKGRG